MQKIHEVLTEQTSENMNKPIHIFFVFIRWECCSIIMHWIFQAEGIIRAISSLPIFFGIDTKISWLCSEHPCLITCSTFALFLMWLNSFVGWYNAWKRRDPADQILWLHSLWWPCCRILVYKSPSWGNCCQREFVYCLHFLNIISHCWKTPFMRWGDMFLWVKQCWCQYLWSKLFLLLW